MAGITTASLVSEFVGTFLLVLTVGCNVLSHNGIWGGVSIGCVLMVSIYALGGASGANFNPAVSFALGLAGKMEEGWAQVGAYSAVQVLAGLIGAQCARLMFEAPNFTVGPPQKFTIWEAGIAEVIYTFMLCFVVLNTAASKRLGGQNQFYGLAIGFVVIAGAYGAGAISGGCFNPAVAIGLGMPSSILNCLIYTLFELAAAAAAVGVFKAIRPEEKDETAPERASEYPKQSKLIAEFVGTYMLVVTVGLNVSGDSKAAAFSIAASLMSMICAVGDVSGGHFNPAVTTAIWCSGRNKVSSKDADAYVLIQILGGVCAGLTYAILHHGFTFPLGPVGEHGWGAVACVEIVFTFVLCFVVLCTATRSDANDPQMIAFAIGSCVTAGGFAAGGISGGSLNPAVSIGIAFAHIFGGGFFYKALIYTVLELVGGLAAVGVFWLTYPGEYTLAKDEKTPLTEKKAGTAVEA